jgi:hypothetical protein
MKAKKRILKAQLQVKILTGAQVQAIQVMAKV